MKFLFGGTRDAVRFRTDDSLLQRLYNTAEEKAKQNLRDFTGRRVLVEGGGYEKIWLETQPMGGAMYALRDMEAALNNQLLFMETRRQDGRLPGSIQCVSGALVPQFNKFQGFCFPSPALDLYYLSGADGEYLRLLYDTLKGFDHYLWATRDSDGDGLLESFCVYDTGEDNALRYGDAPRWWEKDEAPQGYQVVPMASMDIMGFSYSARETLSAVSALLNNGEEALWAAKARDVKGLLRKYFWDDRRGACFDRDKNRIVLPALTHNTLRLMYWKAIDRDMADRFVLEHLLNPEEFFTPMPLPSVAVNDPLFRNNPDNDWSGQPQGLTYQRAIRALENYGFLPLLTIYGRKLFEACGRGCVFTQQFDPFTMEPSRETRPGDTAEDRARREAYGPTVLSVLEYIGRMYGIHIERNRIFWGTMGDRGACEYAVSFAGHEYRLAIDGTLAKGSVDGKQFFASNCGFRVVTDLKGRMLSSALIDPDIAGVGGKV